MPEGEQVVLEQSDNPDFKQPVVRYHGPQPASVLTGLPEGTHYFRLRLVSSGTWSEPLATTVRFVPRGQLFLLLGAGAAVVALTVSTIIVGFLKTREGGSS
jgi:hypothetical protein